MLFLMRISTYIRRLKLKRLRFPLLTVSSFGPACMNQTSEALEMAIYQGHKEVTEYLFTRGAVLDWPKEDYPVRYTQQRGGLVCCLSRSFFPLGVGMLSRCILLLG